MTNINERLLQIAKTLEERHVVGMAPGEESAYKAVDGHFCDGYECDWRYGLHALRDEHKADLLYAIQVVLGLRNTQK